MKVFISYRREDSAGHTGRLYDSLRAHFGDGNIFLDLSGIDSGQQFADVIKTAIETCDVLLAVIGPEWLTCAANGVRRIDHAGDLVRGEILTALHAKVPVIPVLVGGTQPPPAAALPGPLKPIAGLDAHEMSDERWTYDSNRLIQAIEKLAGARGHTHVPRRWLISGAALAAAALVLGGVFLWPRQDLTPAVAGEWTADVRYEWGATFTERLVFTIDAGAVSGTASFLGVPRRIAEGTVDGDRIAFQTRTQEVAGNWDQPHDLIHRYRGRIAENAIAFTMETEGGDSQAAVAFTATRR